MIAELYPGRFFFSTVFALKHLFTLSSLFLSVSSPDKTAPKKLLLNPFRGLEELESDAVEIFI